MQRFKREFAFVVAVFFAASLGFGAGYAASRTWNRAPIIIEACSGAALKENPP